MLLHLAPAQVAPRNLTLPKGHATEVERDTRAIATRAGLDNLRKTLLPKGDAELRFWSFIWTIKGVVLRRTAGHWSALRVEGGWPGNEKYYRGSTITGRYAAPLSGWPAFWRAADVLHVWTLPDETELPPEKGRFMVLDGDSYDVEIQREGVYRAYHYTNPEVAKTWPTAAQIVTFDALLAREFPSVAKS